jgi:hypothetical protein
MGAGRGPSGRGERGPGKSSGRGPNYRRPGGGGGGTGGNTGGTTHKGGCCPMVAALVSVKRGKFRLARRYAAMSVRLMVERMA